VIVLERAVLAIAAPLLCAAWYLSLMPIALARMREYPAKRVRREGQSFCSLCWGELFSTLRETVSKYPEAAKYLLAIFFLQNGTGATFLAVSSQSFLPVFLEFSLSQVYVIIGLVLICAAPASLVLARLDPLKATWKRLWAAVVGMWLCIITVCCAILTGPGNGAFVIVCVSGGVLGGVAFAWYFAILLPAFASITPAHQSAQFVGLLYCVAAVGTIFEPFIYVGIVQSSNNHRVAMFTLLPWALIGGATMMLVDFDKGRREAQAAAGATSTGAAGATSTGAAGKAGQFACQTV